MTDIACTARWASNAIGHPQGSLCGDPVFRRLADVGLCDHHYWRALDAALVINRREQREEETRFYGARTWEASAAEVVYYVQRQSDGLIKIGTSTVFRSRLAALRADHGALQILLTHRGGLDREREMHRKFAKLRVDGRELFRPRKPLMTWIISVRRRQHVETLLPGTLPLADLLILAEPKRS